MKYIIILLISILGFINIAHGGYVWDDETKEKYTQDQNDVLNTNDLNDPLRDGTRSAVENVDGIVEKSTGGGQDEQGEVIKYISKWINYFLALLGLVVIIFIIKDGIILITGGSEKNQPARAFKNVKNYIIALILIGVSYLIVNLIIHFVMFNTTI